MKLLQMFAIISTLTLASALALNATDLVAESIAPPAAPSSDTALQSTEFGLAEGYVTGRLNGQLGWTTVGQPATIISSSQAPETQWLELAPGSDSWASHRLETNSAKAIQVDVDMELFASDSLFEGSHLRIGDMDIGFVMDETGALARVEYPLEDDMSVQDEFSQIIPADLDGSLGWSHIVLQLDFENQQWSLSINGLSITESQPLVGADAEDLSLMLNAGNSSPANVSSLSIKKTPSLDSKGLRDGFDKNAGKDGVAGTTPASSKQKLPLSAAMSATSSTRGAGSQSAPKTTGAQPSFFTVFSPN